MTPPVEVVLRPSELSASQIDRHAVAVFDVLRATTSMTAALAAGVREIRIHADVEPARAAAALCNEPKLLCGEHQCLPPEGFDLGNSPAAFCRDLHADRISFLSTTNGTRAVIAARRAEALFVGALVNAAAVGRRLAETGLPVTLLCAGTAGRVALEDLIGAGAVLDSMIATGAGHPVGDVALMALRIFRACRDSLPDALAASDGGKNVIAAGLAADIDFCARLDVIDIVGRVYDDPLRVVQS